MNPFSVLLFSFLFFPSLSFPFSNFLKGLNRVQQAPTVSRIMSEILGRVKQKLNNQWVGLSVVHLGEKEEEKNNEKRKKKRNRKRRKEGRRKTEKKEKKELFLKFLEE